MTGPTRPATARHSAGPQGGIRHGPRRADPAPRRAGLAHRAPPLPLVRSAQSSPASRRPSAPTHPPSTLEASGVESRGAFTLDDAPFTRQAARGAAPPGGRDYALRRQHLRQHGRRRWAGRFRPGSYDDKLANRSCARWQPRRRNRPDHRSGRVYSEERETDRPERECRSAADLITKSLAEGPSPPPVAFVVTCSPV